MPGTVRYYRLRVRNAADSADAFIFSSEPGGDGPYLVAEPKGDGPEINIFSGAMRDGSYVFEIADADLGAGVRAVTSQLANGSGRYDKLARKAYCETSADGTTWATSVVGFVTDIEVDGIVGIITVSDPLRLDRRLRVFARRSTSFPRGTNLTGEPIDNGFAGYHTKFRPWRMRVDATFAGPPQVVTMEWLGGPVRTNIGLSSIGNLGTTAEGIINRMALPYVLDDENGASFPGLEASLIPVAGGTEILATPREASSLFTEPRLIYNQRLLLFWTGTLPTVGVEYFVKVYPIEVSERAPLHIEMHPVDILTTLWTDAGIDYDSTSAAAVKALIGSDRILQLRLTKSYTLADFQEKLLFGLFGFHFRHTSTGTRELYITRRLSATLPVVTVSTSDVMGDPEGQPPLLKLTETTTVRSVTVRQQIFQKTPAEEIGARPPDEISSYTDETVVDNESAPDAGDEIVYDVPGNITSTKKGKHLFPLTLAREVIDRAGPTGEILVKESVAAKIGDVVISTIAHQVNGNVRGGSRLMQVLRRTPVGPAVELKWLDAGDATGLATVPTFTIAASAATPKSAFVITLTNAAAMIAQGAKVRVEWGFGGSAPASGTLLAVMDPNTETVLTPPRVDSGTRVWVRMRAEHPTKAPSAHSAWSDVDLADLTAPSALSHVGSNVIEWTTGEGPQEVLWRPAADVTDRSLGDLPTGSNRLDLTPYVTPGVSIVATVRSTDPPPYNGVSSSATVTFTTAAASSLNAPTILNVGRLGFDDDELLWDDPGNPPTSLVHIERSIVSGVSGFLELEVYPDDDTQTRIEAGAGTSDTWYRVRYSYLGVYSAYSPVAHLAL